MFRRLHRNWAKGHLGFAFIMQGQQFYPFIQQILSGHKKGCSGEQPFFVGIQFS